MWSGVESDAVSFGSGAEPVPMGHGQAPPRPQPPGRSHAAHQPATLSPTSVVVCGSHNVHVGSNTTLSSPRKMVRRRPEVSPAVRALFRCPVEASDRQLLVTSRYLGAAWRDVARRLGFLGAETDEFEFRADSLREVGYRMLLAWREKQARDATVENLAKALWDEQAYDALFKLAEVATD